MDQSRKAPLAYLVHDINDSAVRRRVDLFITEGLSVGVAGFHRHADTPGSGFDHPAIDLGLTQDAQLGQRARTVLRHLLRPVALQGLCAHVTVIVARNLEMLMLALRVKQPGQRVVYECLDIHRLMLGSGLASRAMRWLERRLLGHTNLVIVSSPAFAERYFARKQRRRHGVLLVENKVPHRVAAQGKCLAKGARREGPGGVLRIGWFGMLRCRRSLEELGELARRFPGRVEVLIAGIPSPAEFPDFYGQVAALPGLRYVGPFAPRDLRDLYGRVDFVWAVDYFEAGLNSDWLLPNRLYEGLAHGVVPIALAHVETGRWLSRHQVGLLITDALAELPGRLGSLTADALQSMRAAIAALPDAALYQTEAERRTIASAVLGYAHA
ncbi:glycosyltransferase [Novosphingobium sp. Leaf2]|uniref:glycosyltransferase n=1 Tax=Novosphingobium sp. Leaf2 TaxID=1735670 RepID=UPI0006FB6275|nr:glycosyltransferase [Novosphingobium sp. Leaf2]KQM13780.1 hypothetical protein ASE49_11990 [Novosphingobium sp. Leaf2]